MASRPVINFLQQLNNVNIPAAGETVVATAVSPPTSGAGGQNEISGWLVITTGTGTTTVTVRFRRGTDTTGPLVGEAQIVTTGAAAGQLFSISVVDPIGDAASQSYVVTVQPAGATGAGTCFSSVVQIAAT